MKKLYSILAALALTFVGVVGASGAASATVECTPSEGVAAYDDPPILVTPASDKTVVTVEASDTWYSWTGGQSDTHPFPSANWNPDNGEHNGFPQDAGVYERPKGNSENSAWFYHEVIAEQSHIEHTDAVYTPGAHHDAIPPVVCDDEPVIVSEWHTWASPVWIEGLNGHVGVPDNAWDQTYVGAGQIAPEGCELTYQQDLYVGTREEIDAVLEDEILTGPNPYEDASIVEDWNIISTVKCDDPPPPTQYEATCTTLSGTVTLTDESFDGDVLTLDVPGGWESSTYALPIPSGKTLADVGTSLDIDASPIQYVGLHIHTTEGTIVFEEEPSYGGNVWSNVAWDGVAAGMGYPAFGSIADFITLNGDVSVTGIDILYTSPDESSTEVTSVSIDCTTFVFRDKAVVIPPDDEPTPTPTPTETTPTPTPTETTPVPVSNPVPSSTPTPVAAQTITPSQPLASTGSEAGWYLLGGIVLVGLGTGLTLARRRYSSQP